MGGRGAETRAGEGAAVPGGRLGLEGRVGASLDLGGCDASAHPNGGLGRAQARVSVWGSLKMVSRAETGWASPFSVQSGPPGVVAKGAPHG